jgi:hypothetical protein
LVRDEDKPLLEIMSRAVTVGGPLATTPGPPFERVVALRKAFHDTVRDPEFIAAAKRHNAELRPMPGEEPAQLYRDLIGAPQDVKDRVKVALEPRKADALEIHGGAK